MRPQAVLPYPTVVSVEISTVLGVWSPGNHAWFHRFSWSPDLHRWGTLETNRTLKMAQPTTTHTNSTKHEYIPTVSCSLLHPDTFPCGHTEVATGTHTYNIQSHTGQIHNTIHTTYLHIQPQTWITCSTRMHTNTP